MRRERRTECTVLESYRPSGPTEERDLARVRRMLREAEDPFDRRLPLHLTGSAVVVERRRRRVLLRWHERQHAWLQVGGHGDAGESDPAEVAVREAREETGLVDLEPWPAPTAHPVHVVVVPVRGTENEPRHEHADVRYLLTTASPRSATPESPVAALRWVDLEDAISEVSSNLAETLRRVRRLLPATTD